jgi:rfaE bifunctional protein nucleotidyltransferase chain/domain
LAAAQARGIKTIMLTSRRAKNFEQTCDICIKVNSTSTARIQEMHIAIDVASVDVSRNETYSVTLKDVVSIRNDNTTTFKKGTKTRDKKIVSNNGFFDIINAGDIQLLKKAKSFGNHLIVGLNSNESVSRLKEPGHPINGQEHRRKVLSSLGCVHEVIIFGEENALDLLHQIKPDVLVKGSDYKISEIVGADIVLQNAGSVQTVDFFEDTSTTKIVDCLKNAK